MQHLSDDDIERIAAKLAGKIIAELRKVRVKAKPKRQEPESQLDAEKYGVNVRPGPAPVERPKIQYSSFMTRGSVR